MPTGRSSPGAPGHAGRRHRRRRSTASSRSSTSCPRAPDVEAVGIGAAGWIDADRSTVLYAPNLAWRDEPLRDEIAAKVHLPVVVENDANVAAWAEFQFGAAKDADDSMVLFTIGTGIGGGIVLGGELVRGAHGIAAELGHVLAVRDGHPCGCGARAASSSTRAATR